MMGYLSCRADSAVVTCDSTQPNKSPAPLQKTYEGSHKKKKNKDGVEEKEDGFSKKAEIQQFSYSDLEAATEGFSSQKLLGKGSHGYVYKGVLRGGKMVAVKKSSTRNGGSNISCTSEENDSSKISNQVENEIDILSKIHSPSLVNLVGFSYSKKDSNERLLVVEFMSNGTLYDVLHSNPRPPGWGRRLRLALQTAKAIHTLHSSYPPVIHRDVKSANVLIDRNFNARLGDFGLALRCDLGRLCSTPPAGTLGYLDPSYVTPDNLSTKTDVFSFGILLLEIISGRKAIDVAHSPPSIVDWAIPIIRKGHNLLSIYDPRIPPPKDPAARRQLALIAAKCVRSCKEKRPTMGEVVESLQVFSKAVPLNLWNNLSVVNNPCLMVDDVGCAIGPRGAVSAPNLIVNAKPRPRKQVEATHHRRTASEVPSRKCSSSRNLKDLMGDMDVDPGLVVNGLESGPSGIRGLGLRVGSGRSTGHSRTHPVGHDFGSDGFLHLRRSQSAHQAAESWRCS